MSSGFDPSELERQMGIDDESIRRKYGDGVNIDPRHREATVRPPVQAPTVDPVVIPPNMQIPGGSSAPATMRQGITLWNLFGVTLNVKKDMSGQFRYTKAITYALPFVIAAIMINGILVPMTAIIWYLGLIAFGRFLPTAVYTILAVISMGFGILGLLVLRVIPWALGTFL